MLSLDILMQHNANIFFISGNPKQHNNNNNKREAGEGKEDVLREAGEGVAATLEEIQPPIPFSITLEQQQPVPG